MGDDRVITLEDLSEGWGTYIDTAIKSLKFDNTSHKLYDLQGRRLTKAPAKGLYIQNGKKLIVK
jgi:SPX domain protein involved in polyphosphate accumulation